VCELSCSIISSARKAWYPASRRDIIVIGALPARAASSAWRHRSASGGGSSRSCCAVPMARRWRPRRYGLW